MMIPPRWPKIAKRAAMPELKTQPSPAAAASTARPSLKIYLNGELFDK
jgi:hypothetical protein